MKKIYVLAMLMVLSTLATAQIVPTTYRGAFAPAPAAMWTDSWTNYDPQNTVYPLTSASNVVTVIGDITTDVTWTSNNVYWLKSQVYVKVGAVLTIQPGTIILADQTTNGACLIITKGSKLIANGTATQPIVFTSDKPVGQRVKGDWGGIVLLGKGAYNINSGIANIEGIAPTSDTQFGGGATPVNNDNSGSLQYVRIEYGGYVFAPNSEINGLTLGAVGSGTTIDHVQVSFTNDDAFEWFGGSVNCSHLVSYRNLDDDFDTDNGYNGKVQFCLSVRDPGIADNPAVSTSEGFESDNNATSTAVSPYTAAIFSNCTMVGPYFRANLSGASSIPTGAYKRAARLRRNTQLKIYNSVFMDYLEGVGIDGVTTETNALNGTLQFRNNLLAGIVTTSRVFAVNSPGTLTAGLNPAFNITSWFAASGNSSQATNSGILTNAYDQTNGQNYTGLDYRPALLSPLLNSASFSEANIAAVTTLIAPYTSPISYCKGAIASPLMATLNGAGISLKWYTVATGGTALATAPTPLTTTVATVNYYVSQINSASQESPRALLAVTINNVAATPSTITGVAAVGTLVGTSTTSNFSIASVVDATSYSWTAPDGVTIVSGQGTTSVTLNFSGVASGAGAVGNLSVQAINSNGCNSLAKTLVLTKILPATPTALVMTNGITTTAVTNISLFVGTTTTFTLTATSITATSFNWNLPSGVNQVSGGNSNVITVNFAGVSAGAGTIPVSVNGVNGVGVSAAAKLITLTKLLPATPSSLIMTNGSTTTAISNISTYVGTTTDLTLKALSVTASTFNWVLPDGVNQTSGGNSNIITVNFANVSPSIGTIAIGVFGVSGVGTSLLSKVLTLTKTLPSTVSVVTGQISGICPSSAVNYLITAPKYATSYNITVPVGSVVTSPSNLSNTTNTLITSDLAFTVYYSTDFASVLPKTIVISSINGVGSSLTNKTITLAATYAVTSITGGTLFNRCNPITFTGNAIGAQSYVWSVTGNATIASGQGTNSITVNFADVDPLTTSMRVNLSVTNSCGITSPVKYITLTSSACPGGERFTVNTEIYPNPTVEVLNVKITADKSTEMLLEVYSNFGELVSTRKIQIAEGSTILSENVGDMKQGLYFVKFINPSTNEIIVKKLIKK